MSTKYITFDEYDEYMTSLSALFTVKDSDKLNLYAFGIGEECGEVLGKLKRRLREGGVTNEEILLEMGDLLGYMSCLATELNSSLNEIALLNINKMEKRKQKKTLAGSGDER